MNTPRTRRRKRARLVALATLSASVLAVTSQLPAAALDTNGTPTPVVGNSTWFDALGSPYGGCGLPQADLDSPHFVALNVYNTPGDYAFYPRPLSGDNLSKMGMWNNGHNCGRWIRVKVSDYCTGTNDGAPGQAFCRNGSWVSDAYNGATLDMIIADSCGDSNAWCRDDPYHIDLAHASLNQFVLNGSQVGDLDSYNHYNNRHMEWEFIEAPDYTGDIKIGFLQGAQTWWAAIAVSHLRNGLHGVEYYADGAWASGVMNGDMGQSYIIKPLTPGGSDFRIRVIDAADQYVNDGREYSFSMPASCANQCSQAYTETTYTTDGGSTPTTTTTTTRPTTTTTRPTTTTTTTTRPTTTTTTSSGGGGCTATYSITGQWPNGFQGDVKVTAGTSAISGWKVTWTFADGQAITQSWSSSLTTSGSTVTATNVAWNGSISAGGSTNFGFIGSWNGTNTAPTVTCTAG